MAVLVDPGLVLKALNFEGRHAEGELVDLFTDAAEQIIQEATGRVFAPEPGDPSAVKVFQADEQWIRVPDLREPTAFVVSGASMTLNEDYTLEPGPLYGPATHVALVEHPIRYTGQTGTASITGKWGFAAVPADVKLAVVTLAARFYKERDAGFADQLIGGDGLAFNYFRQLPPGVQEVVNRYRVRHFAVVGL